MKSAGNHIKYCALMLMIFVSSCNKDDTPELPTLTTNEVMFPLDGGILLEGSLTKPEDLIDYGFYLGLREDFPSSTSQIISLGNPSQDGVFSYEISTGLISGRNYYYKVFGSTGANSLEGETLSFFSAGNKDPIITSLDPNPGHFEDTLNIRGKHFGQEVSNVAASFPNAINHVLSVNDTLIKIRVSPNLQSINAELVISVLNQEVRGNYSLAAPKIDTFEPRNVTFGDTILISGLNFDSRLARNKVYLGTTEAEVVSANRNELKVIVPKELTSGSDKIIVKSQFQESISTESYSLLAPEINEFPNCSRSNDLITITGNYFHHDLFRNTVRVGESEAQVLSGNSNQLQIRLPFGPFPNGDEKISVSYLGISGESENSICISDEWLMISNTLPFAFYGDIGTFVINSTAYVISRPSDYLDNQRYLWKFNESDLTWTKQNLPFPYSSSRTGRAQGNGESAFVYTAADNDNFWEFDGSTEKWIQRPDFPGPRRDRSATFSIGENIYVGIGSDFEVYLGKGYNDFYKYSPITNSWTRVANFDTSSGSQRTEASTFTIGNKAYLVGGASSTGTTDSWTYSEASNSWSRIADFGSARTYTTAFTLNGKGYVANGSRIGGGSSLKDCFVYDPNSNSWTNFYDIGHWGRRRGFSFVLNGTAYIGGGDGSANRESLVVELFKLTR